MTQSGRSLRILLVEDNRHKRIAFKKIFKASPFEHEIKTFKRAEEVLDLLSQNLESFDVLVSEQMLPGLSGLDFFKQVIATKNNLALILVMASGQDELAAEALKSGIDEYIIKDRTATHYDARFPYIVQGVVRRHREKRLRLKTEEALRASEKSLAEAQEIAHIGSWTWEIQSGAQSWTEQVYKLFGFRQNELTQSFEAMLEGVHPDDRAFVRKANREAIEVEPSIEVVLDAVHPEERATVAKALQSAITQNKAYDIEFRILRHDDHAERVIQAKGKVFTNEKGQPDKMLGTLQDVTERKVTEEKLRLSAKVIENIVEGVMITDDRAIIQSVNPAFSVITGYSAEEAIGQDATLLKSSKHDGDFFKRMWGTLKETGHWEGELWNKRKDESIYPERLTIAAIKDDTGRTLQYASVFTDITEAKQTQMQIEHKAYHDVLTGLPNRQLFYDRLTQTINRSSRKHWVFALLYIDIDNFKNINDTLGHSVGDLFLQEMSRRLESCARAGDTVSRLGGDEFTVILDRLGDEDEASLVSNRIVDSLSQPFEYNHETIYSSVSVGVALYPKHGESTEALLKNADIAMYHAKESGKNNFFFFTPSLNDKIVKRATMENALRESLDNGTIQTHFQAIVSLKDRSIVGMEALARWPQTDGTFLPPSEFIPFAEERGLIVDLDKLMIRNSCDFARHATDVLAEASTGQLPEATHIAINLSALDFEESDLCHSLMQALARCELNPKQIGLEITESTIIRNMDHTIRTLESLRSLGFLISVDDFGTGYSSLNYLAKLPLDVLKIDGSFVVDLPNNKRSCAIAKGIIFMAHEMGITVIAEGVENPDQLAFLESIACDHVQGFIFSRPLPASEMESLLLSGLPPKIGKVRSLKATG